VVGSGRGRAQRRVVPIARTIYVIVIVVVVVIRIVVSSRYVRDRKANTRPLPGVTRIAAVRSIVVADCDSVSHLGVGSHAVDFAQLASVVLSLLALPPIDLRKTESGIAIIQRGFRNLLDGQGHHV